MIKNILRNLNPRAYIRRTNKLWHAIRKNHSNQGDINKVVMGVFKNQEDINKDVIEVLQRLKEDVNELWLAIEAMAKPAKKRSSK